MNEGKQDEWINNVNGTSAHKKPFSTNNEARPANITISKIIYYLSARVAKPGRLLVSKLYTLIYIYIIYQSICDHQIFLVIAM